MIAQFLRRVYFLLNKRRVLINCVPVIIPLALSKFFSVKTNNKVEFQLIEFLSKNLRNGDVMIDVGSNIGLVALAASSKVGEKGKVIGFEPNPWVFRQFSSLLDLNNIRNVKSLELAISNNNGFVRLHMNDLDSLLMTRSSVQFSDDGANEVEVMSARLDDLNVGKVNLIKVDVEGAELSVLQGASKLIDSERPIICLEVHGLFFDDAAKHVREVFDTFEGRNYKCFNLMKGESEKLESFLTNTGAVGIDEISGKKLSVSGYGQLVFYPEEKQIIN